MCGRRAAIYIGVPYLTHPEIEALALRYAIDDRPLWEAMPLRDYMYWFCRGYEHTVEIYGI